MFDILRQRLHAAIGTQMVAFADLDSVELDSVDSICISDISSAASDSSSRSSSQRNGSEYNTLASSSPFMITDAYVKTKVIRMVKSIKALERFVSQRNQSKMSMLVFLDMIRDQEYGHVSMTVLDKFLKICHVIPKAYYLHYYMFFLHYAIYYHQLRCTTDVIDSKMIPHHQRHLRSIQLQMKYLQYIINKSRDTARTSRTAHSRRHLDRPIAHGQANAEQLPIADSN